MNQKVGKFISLVRKEKNYTQEALAEKLNVSKNAVSKWERGINLPDVSLMKELCNILDISLNELFEGKRLSDKEISINNEKNIINILSTKKRLETLLIFTEILVLIGIIITITLRSLLASTSTEKIIIILLGSFVWGFGIFLRIKIRKILNNL